MHRKAYLSATCQPYWIFIKLLPLDRGFYRLRQNFLQAGVSNSDDTPESLTMSTATPFLAPAALIRIFDHFADAQQARSTLLEQGFPAHAVQLDTVDDEAVTTQGTAAWRGMFRLVVAIGTPQDQERAHALLQACNGCDIEQRTASHAGRLRAGAGIQASAG